MTVNSKYEMIEERNTKRRKQIWNSCQKLGYRNYSNETDIRAHMSPNHTILYCRINQCASTFTLEVVKRLFKCDTKCLITTAIKVKDDPIYAHKQMQDAFSFTVVRDPYRRLFAAYANQFYLPKENWSSRGKQVIKRSRMAPSKRSLQYGHDVTFAEFINYIVERFEAGERLDEYVRPMHHRSCNPCNFDFDYIAKLETLESDWEYILHQWQSRGIVNDIPSNTIHDVKQLSVFGPITHVLNTVVLLQNSSVPIYNLYLRTWTFYQILGYISKEISMPYTKTDVDYITYNDIYVTIKNAIELSTSNSGISSQPDEAMEQAYSTLPVDAIGKLWKLVHNDCLLYGYNDRPDFLFKRKGKTKIKFDYFKGIDGMFRV